MGVAGIDHALELRVGQDAGRQQPRRQMRPVGGTGRGNRRHGGRLHEFRRVRFRVRNADRLQRIAFVKAGGEARFARRPVAGFVGEFGDIRHRTGPLDECQLRRGGFRTRRRSRRGLETWRGRGKEQVPRSAGAPEPGERPGRAVRRHRPPFRARTERTRIFGRNAVDDRQPGFERGAVAGIGLARRSSP